MNYNYNEDEITWESLGNELLFPKNKFEFTTEEKILVKKLLFKSPPPLEYRRKVSDIFINNIVMVNQFRCRSRNV
jgi:hypothetical protein